MSQWQAVRVATNVRKEELKSMLQIEELLKMINTGVTDKKYALEICVILMAKFKITMQDFINELYEHI